MAFKIFLLDLLMALDADANPTRAAFDSALNRTFAHDVRRIDVDQKVVAHFGRALKKQLLVFVLLAHETELKFLVDDAVALQERHRFARDAAVPWNFPLGSVRLAEWAVPWELSRVHDCVQVKPDTLLAEKMSTFGRNTVLLWGAPADQAVLFVVQLIVTLCLQVAPRIVHFQHGKVIAASPRPTADPAFVVSAVGRVQVFVSLLLLAHLTPQRFDGRVHGRRTATEAAKVDVFVRDRWHTVAVLVFVGLCFPTFQWRLTQSL